LQFERYVYANMDTIDEGWALTIQQGRGYASDTQTTS
jgi:hypothetical protein